MSLSPNRLMAGELPYNPTEPICIIFKKIVSIRIIMQRGLVFKTKITNNKVNNCKSYSSIKKIKVSSNKSEIKGDSPQNG